MTGGFSLTVYLSLTFSLEFNAQYQLTFLLPLVLSLLVSIENLFWWPMNLFSCLFIWINAIVIVYYVVLASVITAIVFVWKLILTMK